MMSNPVYRRLLHAQELVQNTPQPWACWEFSPQDWDNLGDETLPWTKRESGMDRYSLVMTGIIFTAFALLVIVFPWPHITEAGYDFSHWGPALIRGVVLLVAALWLVGRRLERRDSYRAFQQQPHSVVITPLQAQWGSSWCRLFDYPFYCTQVTLDGRNSRSWLTFTLYNEERRNRRRAVTIWAAPVPTGYEAEAAALAARFEKEILQWNPPQAPHPPHSHPAKPRKHRC
ncbi:MAG: Bax inhibitor-1 family protein [Chloroflexota bacterium]|nr:Bax inhibitor-1 family protein [Chloroflexota bacterium]